MRIAFLFALGLVLAGCGVDGDPERPAERPAAKTGVSISGDARIGVVWIGK